MFFQRFGDVCVVAVRGLDRVGVRFRGTVAGLAALNVILVGENELRVARLFILNRFFFVAALALFRAGERTGGRVKIRGVARDRWTLRSFGPFLRITRARRESKTARKQQEACDLTNIGRVRPAVPVPICVRGMPLSKKS